MTTTDTTTEVTGPDAIGPDTTGPDETGWRRWLTAVTGALGIAVLLLATVAVALAEEDVTPRDRLVRSTPSVVGTSPYVVTTDGERAVVRSAASGAPVRDLQVGVDGEIVGLDVRPGSTLERLTVALLVSDEDGGGVVVHREDRSEIVTTYLDRVPSVCLDGAAMDDVSGPVWSPAGDAVAWTGTCATGTGVEFRVVTHEWDAVDVTGRADRSTASQIDAGTAERDGEGDGPTIRVESWHEVAGIERLTLTYQAGAAMAAATLPLERTDAGVTVALAPPEPFAPLAAGEADRYEAQWRPATIGVSPSVSGGPVDRDGFVLAGVEEDGAISDLLLHRVTVDEVDPDRRGDVEGLATPPALTAFDGSPEEAARHWIAASGDGALIGDGDGDAWILLPDGDGALVEIPGSVNHGAFLGGVDHG